MPRISLGKRMSNAEATKARGGQIAERQRTDALALLAAATALLVVSHDKTFLANININQRLELNLSVQG